MKEASMRIRVYQKFKYISDSKGSIYLVICMIAGLLVFSLGACSGKEKKCNNFIETKAYGRNINDLGKKKIKLAKQYFNVSYKENEFVNVQEVIPQIQVDLRYADDENFTGQIIYHFKTAYLRYGTIEKLRKVENEVEQKGYFLKIWDAYRPVSAQFDLWNICPDSTYVADPTKGYSSHSRGSTIDITLTDKRGTDVVMPTGFDDFSAKADRDYSDCNQEETDNAVYLENIMKKYGFKPYQGEWWHFQDETDYPVEMEFIP